MTQELRKLAEAATQGEWTSENVRGAGIQMRVPYKGTTRMTFTEVFRPLPEKEWDAELWANAEYISAASPAVILALLDRLEKAEKDAARYQWLRDTGTQGFSNGVPQRGVTIAMDGSVKLHFVYWMTQQQLDKSIDAAMEASK